MKFSIKDFFSKCDQIRKCLGWKTSESLIAVGSPISKQGVLKRSQKYGKN